MGNQEQLLAFTTATVLLACDAFDNALLYQVERKDDATLALWTGVGVEIITLAAVLIESPEEAFSGNQAPSPAELQARDFYTKPFSELAAIAERLYGEPPYPPSARSFMEEVRNKLLHTGGTRHAGLVAPTLRVIQDMGQWLRDADLPQGDLRHETRVLKMARTEELPGALEAAVREVAAENAAHLKDSLERGGWNDTPALKEIALRELKECRDLS
jgi:hypothetical protein